MKHNLDALFARRSIRRYENRPVAPQMITALLEAAMAAPSARNLQPWHFVVIEDRQALDALSELHPYARMLKEATLAIAVCGELDKPFWVQDCSAATQNILVAACGLGLGSVWLGVHPSAEREAEVRQFLGVPDSLGVLCLIAVGHPAEEKPPAERYSDEKVHRERW